MKTYLTSNLITAGIILAVFFYADMHKPDAKVSSHTCIHASLLGGNCPACSLMDGFSYLQKGNIEAANRIQPNSIFLFLFLILQLFIRLLFSAMLLGSAVSARTIFTMDLILWFVSILLFKTFVLQSAYILYKMMLTGM